MAGCSKLNFRRGIIFFVLNQKIVYVHRTIFLLSFIVLDARLAIRVSAFDCADSRRYFAN